jgi:hypothetical protein
MARVIKVGINFEFYPDGEHGELFEDEPTIEEIVAHAKAMTAEDIDRLVKYNETYEALSVEIVEDGE